MSDGWLLRQSNASGWELWPPATHNGIEGHQHLCHRMISLTDEEVAPAALSADLTRLREREKELTEALEGSRSFAAEVAGDDCPHAAAATRDLHRIAAVLSSRTGSTEGDETSDGG